MAIGRISGQMLKSNLLRSGTDLAFETTLLVLDVSNSRVGVGTATPSRQLHINGTGAVRLPGGTTAERGTGAVGDVRYNSDTGQIEGYTNAWFAMTGGSTLSDQDGNTGIAVERAADQNQIHFFTETSGDVAHIRDDGSFEINNLKIDDLTISSLTTNGDINITPNGTGSTVIKRLVVSDGLDLGDLAALNVGAISVDSVQADDGAGFDLTLADNQAAALEIKEGSNAYITFVTTDSSEQITIDKKTVVSTGVTFQSDTVDINGGAIDGAIIGANSAAAGTFTTATAADVQTGTVKANDGTAAITIADSTGAVVLTTATKVTGAFEVDGSTFIFNESSADVDFRFEGNGNANLLFGDAGNDRIGIKTATPAYTLDMGSATDAVSLPVGNTSERPTGAVGVIRFNSETSAYEGCLDGSTYTEFQMAGDTPIISKLSATGDGSTDVFVGFFSSAPASAANVMIFIDNVYQEPTENYTVSGTTLTFTSTPHNGARIFGLAGFDNTAAGSGGVLRTETAATSFTSSAVTVASFNASSYRSMEAFITTTDSANTEYEVAKALVVHDGTTAYVTVYGQTSSTGSDISTYSATLAGGSVLLQAVSSGGAQTAKVQYSLTSI